MSERPFANWDSGKSKGVTDHGELDGLGDDDHSQYLNTTRHDTTDRHAIGDVVPHDATKVGMSGNETVAGVKTFSSIPVLPASDPTSDNQAVRKKYIDLRAGIGGWIEIPDGSWSYASATTITVPSGAASIYQVSDEIRLKQGGGYKYYSVVEIADTLLTVTGGSDFTVANSTVTDAAFSKGGGAGHPRKYNFTSSPQGFSTVSLNVARFAITGSVVNVYADIGGTSNATTLKINIPFGNHFGYILQGWVVQPTPSADPTLIEAAGDGLFNIYKNGALTPWEATGAKRINLNFSYII